MVAARDGTIDWKERSTSYVTRAWNRGGVWRVGEGRKSRRNRLRRRRRRRSRRKRGAKSGDTTREEREREREREKEKRERKKINTHFELFFHFREFPLQGSTFALLRFGHGVAGVALCATKTVPIQTRGRTNERTCNKKWE